MDVTPEPMRTGGYRRNLIAPSARATEDLADEQRLIDHIVVDPDVVGRAFAVLEQERERPPGRNVELGPIEPKLGGGDDGPTRRRRWRWAAGTAPGGAPHEDAGAQQQHGHEPDAS